MPILSAAASTAANNSSGTEIATFRERG
jgi:hypothetical protein